MFIPNAQESKILIKLDSQIVVRIVLELRKNVYDKFYKLRPASD